MIVCNKVTSLHVHQEKGDKSPLIELIGFQLTPLVDSGIGRRINRSFNRY